MTTSRLLKFFAILSLLSTLAALWLWYATEAPPTRWLIRFSLGSFFAAVVIAFVDSETRPRLMLRFLAALFALLALISLATDISRPTTVEDGFVSTSLMQHLQASAPSFLAALEKSVTSSLAPFVWDPLLTSLLNTPASLLFLILAIVAGVAGRPRRRVQIFINDY